MELTWLDGIQRDKDIGQGCLLRPAWAGLTLGSRGCGPSCQLSNKQRRGRGGGDTMSGRQRSRSEQILTLGQQAVDCNGCTVWKIKVPSSKTLQVSQCLNKIEEK